MKNKLIFVLYVDGVLTTGQFLYSADGKAYKIFGAHDADGLKMLKGLLPIILMTADKRGFPISRKRARDMGLPIELVSEEERLAHIEKKYGLDNVIFMGDGYHDAPILKACLFGIAPAIARKEARAAADFVTESKAGEGAVLDACLKIRKKFFSSE